jgi:hypothetical protein
MADQSLSVRIQEGALTPANGPTNPPAQVVLVPLRVQVAETSGQNNGSVPPSGHA